MIALLDTTAVSAAMRREDEMLGFLQSRRPGELAVAPPVVSEIEYGIRRLAADSRARRLLRGQFDTLAAQLRLLPWTPEASVQFGGIKADLEGRGTLIDDFDIAIAAIALAHRAEVVTANLVHFRRVDGLSAHHWVDG